MALFLSSSGHEIVTREKHPKKYEQNYDNICFNICFPSYELWNHMNYTQITRKEQPLTSINIAKHTTFIINGSGS